MESGLDRVMVAISDPTRRAIIGRLARGPARISDVAVRFPMTLTGFCKHVRVLERAGLVRRTRHGSENTLELSAKPCTRWRGGCPDTSGSGIQASIWIDPQSPGGPWFGRRASS